MRTKSLKNATWFIRVRSEKGTDRITAESIYCNRLGAYMPKSYMKERGIESFLNLADLKETLNWSLNGYDNKYQFKWGMTAANGVSEGFAYVFCDYDEDTFKHLEEYIVNNDILKTANLKYNWKYGDNGVQEYYDVTVNNTYLLVFKNRWDRCWMCSVGDRPIHDKTRNDYQRKKQGLPKGCCTSKLKVDTMLCGFEPTKLMKKVEYCYEHGVDEVSSR